MSAFTSDETRGRSVDPIVEVTAQGVELDLDVLEIAKGEWAIHGRLAYEGQVIAATFASAADAWAALTGTSWEVDAG